MLCASQCPLPTPKGQRPIWKRVILLYLLGTRAASSLFWSITSSITITLTGKARRILSNGIGEVISNLLLKIVDNPCQCLAASQLHWDPFLGHCLWDRHERAVNIVRLTKPSRHHFHVEWIINLAPFRILGLVFTTIAIKDSIALSNYRILLPLVLDLVPCSLVIQSIDRLFSLIIKTLIPMFLKCLPCPVE